jgi:hypothetical protein
MMHMITISPNLFIKLRFLVHSWNKVGKRLWIANKHHQKKIIIIYMGQGLKIEKMLILWKSKCTYESNKAQMFKNIATIDN